MPWDRRGGHGLGPTGDHVTWSLAEGARGTRWRESATRDGALVRSLLLEVTPVGAVARLEISTAGGLLTLHAASDGSAIHGNVVTAHGIRHLAFDWSPSHELVIGASPTAAAIVVRRLATTVAVGRIAEVDVLAVDDTLEPHSARWEIERPAVDRWLLQPVTDGRTAWEVHVAPDGLPILPGAETWPLES